MQVIDRMLGSCQTIKFICWWVFQTHSSGNFSKTNGHQFAIYVKPLSVTKVLIFMFCDFHSSGDDGFIIIIIIISIMWYK